MKKYSRVSYAVRCQIYALLQAKKPISEIASQLGYHKTTIYREISRNKSSRSGYLLDLAQKKSQLRYRSSRKYYSKIRFFEKDIYSGIEKDWSPQHISGRIRRENNFGPSHVAIYKFIKTVGLEHKLRRHNKRGAGRYLQRRRYSQNGLSIWRRPNSANKRTRVGHWERDTMHTLNGVQLLICIDRKSRFVKLSIAKKRTTKEIDKLTTKLIESTGRKYYTVTNDNGGDFKASKGLKVKTYFCDPMKPQQRGTVERAIKTLRQYIKRKTDVSKMSSKELKKIEDKINYRPMVVLDYKTPYEVYYNKKVALVS